jgi:hypothetical protein
VIIDAWDESYLADIIDTRPFSSKPGDGKKRPTIAVWLCFEPDEPEEDFDEASPTPLPTPKRSKKKGKAKVKTEVKSKIKQGIEKEAVDKRPRSASSIEPNIPAKRLPIGSPNVATRAMQMEQVTEEDQLKAGDDGEAKLPSLYQLTHSERRKK